MIFLGIKKLKTPLTSFLQIIMGGRKLLVIDGRRIYTMSATFNQNKTGTQLKY